LEDLRILATDSHQALRSRPQGRLHLFFLSPARAMTRTQSNNTALHVLIIAAVAVAVFLLFCVHRVQRLGKSGI
jgi:hypothetical protein